MSLSFKPNSNSRQVTSEFKETAIQMEPPVIKKTELFSNIVFKDSLNTILKSSMNIFNDLILPVTKRIGIYRWICSLYTHIFL